MRRWVPIVALVAVTVGLVFGGLLGGGTSLAKDDSLKDFHRCLNGGYLTYLRSDGTTFATQSDCTQYVAHGGTLVVKPTATPIFTATPVPTSIPTVFGTGTVVGTVTALPPTSTPTVFGTGTVVLTVTALPPTSTPTVFGTGTVVLTVTAPPPTSTPTVFGTGTVVLTVTGLPPTSTPTPAAIIAEVLQQTATTALIGITGTGFLPDANVFINVTDSNGAVYSTSALTDTSGAFSAERLVNPCAGGQYHIEATDATNTVVVEIDAVVCDEVA